MITDRCLCINIPQTVKVRVYELDVVEVAKYLREHRKQQKLTNQEIADRLGVPKTQIDHYFRTDRYAALPDPDVWGSLAKLLGISNPELDKKLLTFEERDGVFESAERCYWSGALCPTLTTSPEDITVIV